MINLSRYEMMCGHKADAETLDGKPFCTGCICGEVRALHSDEKYSISPVCNHDNFQIMRDPDTKMYYVFCFDCLKCSGDHKNKLNAMIEFIFKWGK